MNQAPSASNGVDLDHFRPLRIDDLFRAFWRHRLSAILVALVLLPFLVFLVWLIPAQYDSYAQLLVRLGRGAVSLDPTASLSPSVSLQDSRSSQVNSVREMMQSRALAQRVVREIGAGRLLEPRSRMAILIKKANAWMPAGSATQPLGDLSADEVDKQIEEEIAIMQFQKMMNIFVAQDAYTINIEVRSEDPFLSQDLLAKLIEVYQEHHAAAHRSEGSYEFFAEQTDTAYTRAMSAKEALRAARSQRGMVDVGSSQAALRTLLSQIESDLIQTEDELASADSEVQNLVSEIDSAPTTIESEVLRGIQKTAGSTMRQSLYDLEVRYNELASKYKDDHPKMRALREQLDASSRIANDEQGDQPQTKEAINPIRQALELTHRQTLTRIAGLTSKQSKLITQREKLLVDLDRLHHDEVDMTEMNWEANLAEQEYLRAAEARDNAKMIDQLASGRVSEIAVVQEASLGLKKVKPQRGMLAVLMVFVAFGLGAFQALTRGLLFAPSSTGSPVSTRRNGSSVRSRARFDSSHGDSSHGDSSHGDSSHGDSHEREISLDDEVDFEERRRVAELRANSDEFTDSASIHGVPR